MKIISTIYRTMESDWKIRIAPRKLATGEYDTELIEFWKPSNKADDSMLMFNPSISLNIKNRAVKDSKAIIVPINLVYAFENCLSVIYNKLSTSGLYKVDRGKMYIDAKIADKCSIKLSVFKDSITFIPIIIYAKHTEEPIKGIRLYLSGTPILDLRHNEVREACEILSHLDINTYSVALAMLEQMSTMNEKLDAVLSNQVTMLEYLNSLIVNKQIGGSSTASTPFTWESVGK